MNRVTRRNDFHRTTATVRVEVRSQNVSGYVERFAYLSPSQTRRVGRKLCGIKGCSCGTIRGDQPTDVSVRFAQV